MISPSVPALPTGGGVAAGQANISSPSPGSLRIDQSSNKAILEWGSFNIGSNETVHFQQPAGGAALNRIDAMQGVSQIFGQLSATGQIVLVNPAGIYFSPTARVDVGGLIASTANISNANFMAGNYIFDQPSPFSGAAIINEGRIRAAAHGLVALIGATVRNDGLIQAHLGTVVLGAGNKFTFDFSGDQLINFVVDEATTQAGGIRNTGAIMAHGGKILMVAKVADQVLDNVINTSGIIEATSVSNQNGVIVLSGGNEGIVKVSGKIDVSGKEAQQKGGTIHILGQNIALVDSAILDASGDAGGGTILIGGDYQGQNPAILNAENTWIEPNVSINADALNMGNGGKIIVWADNNTFFYGDISAKGGIQGGDGGFVETSGKNYLEAMGTVNASAPEGTAGVWLLDPANVNITGATANGGFDGGNPNTFTTSANAATANAATINASLNAGTSVTILTTPAGTQAGNITLTNAISKTAGGDATLTLNAMGSITLNNSITSTSGALEVILLANPSPPTTNNITINNIITTNGGNFSSTSGDATTLASVITTGSGTVTFNVNQDAAGGEDFLMNAGGSISTSNTSANAVSINVNAAGGGTGVATLQDITIGNGGTITVATNTGGNITGGDITQAAGTLLNAGSTGTVTLTNPQIAGNNIGTAAANIQISAGNLNLTTGAAGGFVTNTGTGSLNLGTINSTGAFNVTSTASSGITDSGTITVTGTTTLVAGTTQNITLDSSSNDFGTLAITSANNATIVDTNGLIFGASTINGNLNVTAGGDVTDSAALSVAGTATFAVGSNNIVLDTAGNNFTTVTIPNANNVTLRDANSIILGNLSIAGTFGLTTAGAVTQSGPAVINGVATFTAGAANNIILDNINNNFTTLVIASGNDVTIRDLNALQFGAATSTVSGNLNVTTAGNISQLGGALLAATGTTTLSAGSSNSIILANTTNDFNILQISNTNAATIRDTNSIILGTSSLGNTFTLTADTSISQSGALTVPTLIAKTLRGLGGAITLGSANTVNTINLQSRNATDTANSPGPITFTNTTGFDIAAIGTTSTINLTAGGIITDSGTIAGSTLTTSSIGGTILDSSNTVSGFNATNTGSGNIQLINTGTLGITGISQTGGGNIVVQNAGQINLSNAITADSGTITLNANTTGSGGNFVMNAGSSITTGNATSSAVSINVNTGTGGIGTAVLRDITIGSGGTISVRTDTGSNTAGGDITQVSGTLNAGTGTVTLLTPHSAGLNIGTVGVPIEIVAGTLNASSGNNGIFITNTGTSTLTVNTFEAFRSDTNLAGDAQIISSGAVQQGLNPIHVNTFTVKTLNNAGANITFNNPANSSTSVNLQTRNAADTADVPGTISYRDATGVILAGLRTSGNATIVAQGTISDTAVLVVGGTLTTTSVGGLTFNNANQINQFNATNSGSGNISFTGNTIPITLTGITQSGGGTVTVSNTGMLTIANGAVLNTGDAALTITTTDLNVLGTINSGAGTVSITQNTAGGSIGLGNTSGTMSITGSELQNITANNLTLTAPNNGQIIVDGITSANSANIGAVTLTATAGTLGTITFQNNSSSFKTLTATADNQITLGTNLTTTVGNLTFNAAVNGIFLSAPVQLTSGNNITFNDALNGTQNLTLNASNDITFNADVGNTAQLAALTISLANDITNVNGNINVTNLALNTSFANLTGFVDGSSGQAAIDKIVLLNTIGPGTHFFDGIDMFSPAPIPPIPPVPPTPTPTTTPTPLPIPIVIFSNVTISQIINGYLYSSCPNDDDKERECPLPIMIPPQLDYADFTKDLIINRMVEYNHDKENKSAN